MSKALPWYKRNPTDWRDGTRRMSFELRGFYSAILDAMWDLQGQIPKDAIKLAVMLDGNPRSIRKLLPQLLAAGKLIETANGYYNPRMMADILGVEKVPVDGEFAPVASEFAANSAPIARELAGNSSGIQREFDPKVSKNPTISTREERVKIQKEEKEGESGTLARDKVSRATLVVSDGLISHPAFTISIESVNLNTAGRLPRSEIVRICHAHALQWAAEIDAGKPQSSVLPQKIANFLAASVMGEINRSASAGVRPRPMSRSDEKNERARALLAQIDADIARSAVQ